MAQVDIGNTLGVVDVRKSGGLSAVEAPPGLTSVNYSTISSLRSRLNTLDATTYTSAYLDSMSENDMVYALRLKDDPTSV